MNPNPVALPDLTIPLPAPRPPGEPLTELEIEAFVLIASLA
jgi:hypothetical protein